MNSKFYKERKGNLPFGSELLSSSVVLLATLVALVVLDSCSCRLDDTLSASD